MCTWICIEEEKYEKYANFMSNWEIEKVKYSTLFTTLDKVREEVIVEEKQVIKEEIEKDKEATNKIIYQKTLIKSK